MGQAKATAIVLERSGMTAEAILELFDRILATPAEYVQDDQVATLAQMVALRAHVATSVTASLREVPLPYQTWGVEHIDREARMQMERALRLPIAVAGALMPDAHVGYGLPIGGVLATTDAVIPYAVGVDIACRMRLSVYPESPDLLKGRAGQFRTALISQTHFGMAAKWDAYAAPEHAVLDDPEWNATRFLKSLQSKAHRQIATSGTGNHFVEWGEFSLYADDSALGLQAGKYLALLSHSGSRGVGFKIANNYTAMATRMHPTLDKTLQHLAWLPMASEAGQEYWRSMELAGRFASANHELIHRLVATAVGLKEMVKVENHHNFAWRETLPDGTEAIVHRKGATPAGQGVMGIIPGSMGDAGYVVRGRGLPESLNSASHGAGRKMSRRAAISTITKTMRDTYLHERGVTLLGGGLDESPQAYKDIQEVITAQQDLVDIVGKFTPRIVRMADEPGDF